MKSQRLTYVDVTKGIAMLLVVMHHCGGSLDSGMTILTMTDVPLFFLCSGYLAYKTKIDYTKEFLKKSKGLLIPFVLALLFVAFVRHLSPITIFLTDITKSGYWFLEALYIIFVLYWGISLFRTKRLLYFTSAVSIEIVLLIAAKYSPETIDNTFCFSSLSRYFPCFMAGVYLREYKNLSSYISEYKSIGMILLLLSAIGFIYKFSSSNISFIAYLVAYSTSAILLFLFIMHNEDRLPKVINTQLCVIGKYSLNIYIIHFFLVPTIPYFMPQTFVGDFIYSLSLSIIIAYLSILIGKFLTYSTPLDKILR